MPPKVVDSLTPQLDSSLTQKVPNSIESETFFNKNKKIIFIGLGIFFLCLVVGLVIYFTTSKTTSTSTSSKGFVSMPGYTSTSTSLSSVSMPGYTSTSTTSTTPSITTSTSTTSTTPTPTTTTSTTTSLTIPTTTEYTDNKVELYSECNYIKNTNYKENTNFNVKIEYDDIIVKSLKIRNCKITLYSEKNYKGDKTTYEHKSTNIANDGNNVTCLNEFKSVIIEPF
jgi:hypothetical protein